MPAALFHDAVYRRKTQPCAAAAFLRCIKRLENVCERLGAHADSRVRYAEHHVRSRLDGRLIVAKRRVQFDVAGLNHQLAPIGHRVARVDNQIQNDLLDLSGVGLHRSKVFADLRFHLDRFAHQTPHQLVHV